MGQRYGVLFHLIKNYMYDKFGNLTPEQYFMKTNTELTCMKFYRRILMTNKYTSSLAAVGEPGRYPAHISIINKIIKFWHRLANLDESCLLKQAYNVELSYHHRNSHQWLSFVYDTMKLCDMEDYLLDPSKSSASFIVNKITRIGSLNFGAEQYGQVFATLMLKVVVINSDYIGISKNRLSLRVI